MAVKKRKSGLDRLTASAEALQLNNELDALYRQKEELVAQVQSIQEESAHREIDRRFATDAVLKIVSVSDIKRYEGQPRKTFEPAKIQEMVEWLRRDGQKTPLKLISVDDGYVIWDGERRWRSAPLVPMDTLEGLVLEEMPSNLHREILREILSREDLNILDRGEALVHDISEITGVEKDVIPKLVRAAVRELERAGSLKGLQEVVNSPLHKQSEWLNSTTLSAERALVIQVLLDYQINPAAFSANELNAIALPKILKAWVREKGLKVKTALLVKKLWSKPPKGISDGDLERFRTNLLQRIVFEDLSIAKVRGEISQLYENPLKEKHTTPKRAITELNRLELSRLTKKQVEMLKKELYQFLSKLENI